MKNDRQPSHKQLSISELVTQTKVKALSPLLALLILCLLVFLVFRFGPSPVSTRPALQGKNGQQPVASPSLLPGQKLWKDNVSSFLFGTNDTQEWVANNIETNTSMQLALKNAHFTVMRTFFLIGTSSITFPLPILK